MNSGTSPSGSTHGGSTDGTDREGAFEAERPRLVGLAYRMCGSFDDAEDVLQEAWLRWHAADRAAIESPAAWLTTVVTRLSIDRLRVLKRERERYVGPWLPEPVVDVPQQPDQVQSLAAPGEDDPQRRTELADSLTTTFLLMLEELSETERAALLLVAVFGETPAHAAAILDRSPQATRQLVSRARRKLGTAPAATPRRDPAEMRVAEHFVAAAVSGDMESLRALMSSDVVALSDGGSAARAARRPVLGIERVSRYVVNLTRRAMDKDITAVLVAGRPGVLVSEDGVPDTVTWFEVVDQRVHRIHSMRNPDKLRHVAAHPEMI